MTDDESDLTMHAVKTGICKKHTGYKPAMTASKPECAGCLVLFT